MACFQLLIVVKCSLSLFLLPLCLINNKTCFYPWNFLKHHFFFANPLGRTLVGLSLYINCLLLSLNPLSLSLLNPFTHFWQHHLPKIQLWWYFFPSQKKNQDFTKQCLIHFKFLNLNFLIVSTMDSLPGILIKFILLKVDFLAVFFFLTEISFPSY